VAVFAPAILAGSVLSAFTPNGNGDSAVVVVVVDDGDSIILVDAAATDDMEKETGDCLDGNAAGDESFVVKTSLLPNQEPEVVDAGTATCKTDSSLDTSGSDDNDARDGSRIVLVAACCSSRSCPSHFCRKTSSNGAAGSTAEDNRLEGVTGMTWRFLVGDDLHWFRRASNHPKDPLLGRKSIAT